MSINPYEPSRPPVHVAPKSPGLAVFLSFLIPGLGSMTSGSGGVGTLILVSYIFSWLLTTLVIGFVLVPVVWIWGMIHANSAAVRWNANHGIIS
jgi:TM2 domain-containing membrane protein YozV